MNIALPENIKGLSSEEAKKRLLANGYNELPAEKRKRLLKIILDILKEPMILLLLACIAIYTFSGDFRESIVLGISIFFIIFISVYQENKTEKALSALTSLASPQAFVWRDNQLVKIPGREVVCGDVIFLKEGDRVPADGVLLWDKGISINESLLTGESVPVNKNIGKQDADMERPGGEQCAFVYSGTLVVAGQGIVLVKAIGYQTEIGRIGKILDSVQTSDTPLQKNFSQLVEQILVIAILLCVAVVFSNLLTKHSLLPSILSGITLAMAILPEEFPVVLAVFLSIGAWRLSKYQTLVRQMSAVESLGAATVLCVDKTGTLTMNQMKVRQVFLAKANRLVDFSQGWKNNKEFVTDEALKLLIKSSALASTRNSFDPLEGAIKEVRRELFHKDIYDHLIIAQEHPLTSEFLVMVNLWREGGSISAHAKGAPEALMTICDLSLEEVQKVNDTVKKMAADGLRILGVAMAEQVDLVPNAKHLKLKFLGLLGFMDPVRTTAAAAMQECAMAGIKVKMITGDYSETAKSIARQAGLENYDQIISGADFISLGEEELRIKIKESRVFARMMPEYKLQIISALKADGEVVVMTGDGVNDGPALKAADIGVAMGKRGTDVAREAADIVLLDDNFSSLVGGVREGRRIFDNLQRAVVYLIAVHLPIAFLSLVPILLGWPLIFFPVHIMFLELLVDPVCSIVFEAEPGSADLMKRSPRNSKKSILNHNNFLISLLQGLSIIIFVFIAYYYGIISNWSGELVRTTAFVALVSANILMILSNRSWTESIFSSMAKKNSFLWPIIVCTVIFLLLAIYNPFLREVFSFSSFSLGDWFMPLVLSLFPMLIFELYKKINKQGK